MRPESLETRNLLSLLISAKPTLEVQLSPGVHHFHGGFAVTQPATIHVSGTAQPTIGGLNATVEIFAEDRNGNIVNSGQPLATATPDQLGLYHASFTLPSLVRKDTAFVVALETVSGSITGNLVINPTTLSGLNSDLTINGTTLRNFSGALTINAGTISNLSATVADPGGTISNLSGPITITAGTTVSGITGSVATPTGTALTLTNGTITTSAGTISALTGTLTVPAGTTVTLPPFAPGTIGAINGTLGITAGGTVGATTGTLTGLSGTLGSSNGAFTQTGTGTLGAQTGSLTGATGTTGATTSTLTQTGTATESSTTGTESNGTGAIDPTTGTETQTGTATIAGTTGTLTTPVTEYAASDPVTFRIHVPPGLATAGVAGASALHRPAHVHPLAAVPHVHGQVHTRRPRICRASPTTMPVPRGPPPPRGPWHPAPRGPRLPGFGIRSRSAKARRSRNDSRTRDEWNR